jgi:hypothetical protein
MTPSSLHPLNLLLATVQCHNEKLLNFSSLLQNCLAQKVHFFCFYLEFFLFFFDVKKFQFQGFQVGLTLLFVFCERFFFFGNFLRNGLLEVLKFIFVGFDFGFLEGADRLVLLEFFFVESDIDFKLVTFVEDFESLFFKFLKFGLKLVQLLL